MRVAIASDLHFGDSACALVQRVDGQFVIGPKYEDFKSALEKRCDYLVLLGDVFDFSVAQYAEAYAAARAFFRQLRRDDVADQVIYVPGNHDFAFWQTVRYETDVINRIKRFKPPRLKPRWSVPGIIDDRASATCRGFSMPLVRRTKDGGYGGLFLDDMSRDGPAEKPLTFNVAYPNLYLVTDQEEAILLTHGQYFEGYWAFGGELLNDIGVEGFADVDIDELVRVNLPLSEIGSAMAGQSGRLSQLIGQVKREVENHHELRHVMRHLSGLFTYIDRRMRFPWYASVLELLSDFAMRRMRSRVIAALKKYKSTRFDEAFVQRPEVRRRVAAYHLATVRELGALNATYDCRIPVPRIIIFGHTHEPIAWGERSAPTLRTREDGSDEVVLYNSGGWLWRGGNKAKVGAAVFRYETGKGVDSVLV